MSLFWDGPGSLRNSDGLLRKRDGERFDWLIVCLSNTKVQPEERLPGRGQGPALLDLVQERALHHHHVRDAEPAAEDDGTHGTTSSGEFR